MEDQAYLEPDFDPNSLTVPRLRSILVAHNINYPSSAKKGQLIEIFNEQVVSQARKLRTANSRVKRTSKGIEDVPSSHATANGEHEEDDIDARPAPPSTLRKSGSRRTTRARTEEAQEVAPTPRSVRHSTAPPDEPVRRLSSKHVRGDGMVQEEPERERPASKKSRFSAVTPHVRSDRAQQDESPFSDVNVFQTGSSPPPGPRSREPERRQTAAPSASRDAQRRQSGDGRRQTENARPVKEQTDGAILPTRRMFDMPVARVKKEQEAQPTEEFTPEEHQELVQAKQSGQLVPAPRRARPAANAARTGVGAIAAAMLLGLAAVWRQEKVEVGYCGVGRPTTELAGVKIPEWAEFIRPQCEPCPPHAYCGEKLETMCEPDFVLTPHPLSLGGLLPLAPSCEPDSAKARKVSAVKERAVEELRERNAKYECGEAAKPQVRETELKQAISTKKRKGMSNEEFEDLWASAIGEIRRADEVVSGADGSGHLTLRSHSLARIPLACAIRRSLLQTLGQYIWQLIVIVIVLSSGGYARYRITSGAETERKAKELAGLALEKLSQQAALHAYDPDAYGDSYISVAQLRDDVLREEFSASRRKALWEKVQRKVEGNSNVRPMVREGRSGDVGRVWDWVGAVQMIEGTPSTVDRRKSGRVSFGGVTEERLIEPRREEMTEVQKWKEGGKYY
ncbi:hypothetical protein BAUCODRAFT_71355 [Baudoinia panamericana UAMH 10762]|uniref:LEM-like domain-containing protein n=1 Tax=Baudoinia panamericana (strain UAMH 10762) TaxID=717646 RepID=M2NA09_BAUPA|nr:uncharacterized protein BAUCODRAFT_71355 [Baudoinia panamericana UAMH 10762]EMC95969.1 hypothetical protein BAUCODRAFT_71355 [Baudoinia panamericana UAMH 10762]